MKEFQPHRHRWVAVAADLGGTRVRAAAVAHDGCLAERSERPVDRSSPGAYVASVADVVERASAALEPLGAVAGPTPLPVIVGATGPIGPDGRLVDPPNLEPAFRGLPLRALLVQALGRPVLVGLDTHLALLGEGAAGALAGVRDGLYLTFSTGVGGALLAGGSLVTGARGVAGEVGHLPITAGGPRCGCGGRGHLEAWSSGPSIAEAAVRRAALAPATPLAERIRRSGPAVTGADVARWAADGDVDAAAILSRARAAAATAVTALAAVTDPAVVVLGGGVVLGDPEAWIAACRERLDRTGLEAQRGRVAIVPAALGDDAGLHGGVPYARLVAPELVAGAGEA